MNRIPSILIVIIGLLGTITSIYAMPNDMVRTISFGVFVLLIVVGFMALIIQEISLPSAWSILKNSKYLGVKKIHVTGTRGEALPQMANASTIRIMAVSGNTIVKLRKDEIIHALRNKRADIRLLIAQPGSVFVSDVEAAESTYRIGQISPEIISVKQLLYEYWREALNGRKPESIGKIYIGHYSTHLRVSLIICDDAWGWATLNLPPKRAVQSVSLELVQTPNGLLKDAINHFEACWDYAFDNQLVHEVR